MIGVRSIGRGSEAYVYGPFDAETVRMYLHQAKTTSSKSTAQMTSKQYVIKAYKTTPHGFPDPIKFWNDIRAEIKNKSIIIPIRIAWLPIDVVRRYFLDFPVYRRETVMIEVQEYGGQDFFQLFFEKTPPRVLSYKGFRALWKSVVAILEDAYLLIKHKNMILTDIKMENMVWTDDGRLRLIDVQVQPDIPDPPFRVVTADIKNLPIQYFGIQWKTRGQSSKRTQQLYTKLSDQIFKNKSHTINDIVRYIHHDIDSFEDAREKFTRSQRKTTDKLQQKFFFVLYPVFFMIIIMVKTGRVVTHEPVEQEHIQELNTFCLYVLRERGHLPTDAFFHHLKTFLPPPSLQHRSTPSPSPSPSHKKIKR